MSAQIADFNIRFNADSAKFQKDVDYAKKMLRGYTKEANAANDSNVTLGKSLEGAADKAKSMGRGYLEVAGQVSAGVGVVTGSIAYLVSQQAQQAREVERMSTVAQVSVEQIQALSYASEQYSISGDKMADILKDVNDKLGEYASTGGGEFKDFFEQVAPQVGLTVEELKKLSSPEVLVRVKDAMDQANVPMKEQLKYLEQIASDSSALMPLLDNKGRKLYELTQKYEDLNVAMSQYDIEKFKEMDQSLKDTSLKLQKSFATAVLGASDQIDWLTDKVAYSVSYWGALFDSMSQSPKTKDGILKRLGGSRDDLRKTRIELEAAKKVLSDLQATENSAANSTEAKARLANSGFNDKLQVAKDRVASLTQEVAKYNTEVDRLQKKYEDDVLGFNRKPPRLRGNQDTKPDQNPPNGNSDTENQQAAGAARLAALDMQYASEQEKLQLAHEQRLRDIEAMQLSEQELSRRGFETMAALKTEYREREKEFYALEQEEAQLKQDEAIQREIDAFARKEDEKNRKAAQAAQQRAETEKRIEQQVVGMKMQFASQTLGLIEQTAKEGSAIQKAAFLAQKVMAAMQVVQQGEVAAMAALSAPPIGLGPIAGAGMATTIRMMSAASAGMIMGQAIAGMAHSGISEVPAEGTWLLDKGERVYTNYSAKQIDQMYNAIMAMYRQPFAANDPINRVSKDAAAFGPRSVVNIYGAPEGTRVEERQEENGDNVTDVFLSDLDQDGPMSQSITRYFGVPRKGM